MNGLLIGVTFWAIVLLSSLWVAVDSSRLKLVRYNTGLSYKPLLLFFLMIPVWYVSFPWYLVVRARIRSRKLIPMDEPNQRRCHGFCSPRAKLGMSAIVTGIVIGLVFQLVSVPGQRLSFVGMIVLSLATVSIIFGSIVVLSTLVQGWLGCESKSVDDEHVT